MRAGMPRRTVSGHSEVLRAGGLEEFCLAEDRGPNWTAVLGQTAMRLMSCSRSRGDPLNARLSQWRIWPRRQAVVTR